MKESEEMNISLDTEHLLSLLFGKANYHGHCGCTPLATWKRDLLRIVTAISRTIELNLEGNEDKHKADLLARCKSFRDEIKTATTTDLVNDACIRNLTRIVFGLLGTLPSNWNKRATLNDGSWRVNQYRSIFHFSTAEQKAARILDLAQRPELKKDLDADALWDKRWGSFKQNPASFVRWFQMKFPKIYDEWLR